MRGATRGGGKTPPLARPVSAQITSVCFQPALGFVLRRWEVVGSSAGRQRVHGRLLDLGTRKLRCKPRSGRCKRLMPSPALCSAGRASPWIPL